MTKVVNYKCLIDSVKVLDETRESRYFDFGLTGTVTEKLQVMRDHN